MPRRDAIDVSVWQGMNIDWPTVAQHVATAATKATQGNFGTDKTLARNRAGMAAAGIRRRFLYHWLSPGITAKAQAAHFLATVGTLAPGEGVLLDVEEVGVTADQAAEWCAHVEAATGRPCAVYTGVYTARSSIWPNARLFNGQRARWLAGYVPEDVARRAAAPHEWDAWQWTSSGQCPGVPDQTIDLNQIDRHDRLDAACGLLPPPAPDPLEDDMMPTIYTVEGATAAFVTLPTTDGTIHVRWSGPGTPAVKAMLDGLQASGVKVRKVPISACKSWTLHGPVPVGDKLRSWSPADFHATES